ncbi:phage tail assembly protein [Halodesulfovibrio aestuarii]|uniref:Phage tail assembly protein n=1 Tax=Halodesulfovibrio aestuarii TaxID=126333 RepID=A0ABV4JSZ4_9BACT
MRTEQIKLKFPVTVAGHEYKELTVRSAKVRDQVIAQKSASDNSDVELVLFSNLCEVSRDVIEELEMTDYYQLQQAYQGFLA